MQPAKKGGRPAEISLWKSRIPDKIESLREVKSGKNRPRAQLGFVKPIRNGPRKVQNLIESRSSRAETGTAGRENGVRLHKG